MTWMFRIFEALLYPVLIVFQLHPSCFQASQFRILLNMALM